MTPFRAKAKGRIVYSDHYSLLVEFKDIPKKEKKVRNGVRHITWNTNKPGGWDLYFNATNINHNFNTIASMNIEDPNIALKKLNKEINDVKFNSFGKVSIKKSRKLKPRVDQIFNVHSAQTQSIETEQQKLLKILNEKGQSAAIFKLRENIIGSKKNPLEPVAINDPATGFAVLEPEEIKQVSLRYCVQLLTNRLPNPEYVDQYELKKTLHLIRMQEYIEGDIEELTWDMFHKSLRKISQKPGDKYKFILRGGQSLINAIYNILYSVWKTEIIPSDWHKSELVQLFKGRGSISNLDNMRHIHIKSETAKLFGHIVMSEAKENIYKKMTKFQIATKPGHRSSEHLYVIKSIVALVQSNKKAVIATMWDLCCYFNSESLIDCLSELYKSDVKGKLYRLVYKMNENIRIAVNTPVGQTEFEDTGEGIGQGTSDGAILSAVNLDSGVKHEFDGANTSSEADNEQHSEEVSALDDVFDVTLVNGDGETTKQNIEYKDMYHPIIFQDDLFKVSEKKKSFLN